MNKINEMNKNVADLNIKSFKFGNAYDNVKTDLKNFLVEKINDLTMNYGLSYNPFVNGKYMIFMVDGPWFNNAINSNNASIKDFISDVSFFNKYKSTSTRLKYQNFLATDVEVPEPSKEYINISARSQTISHYQREIILPDFSISYLENNDLYVIRYHELWHKTIELYRRGKIKIDVSELYNEKSDYFYHVPYANSVFVLIFDIKYNVRGLIYLVGVKPVSFPLKQVIGNRSGSKMSVYNIQYRLTNMYYKFFNNTMEFNKYLEDKTNVLALLFSQNLLNSSSSTTKNYTKK